MTPNDHEGRADSSEWARWRGGLEARVGSLEKAMDTLVEKVAIIDRTVTRTEGRVETLQTDVVEAAGKIDRGREDAVKTLQDTIKGRDVDAMSWRITRWQVVIGAVLTLLVGTASSLIVLAIAGKLT